MNAQLYTITNVIPTSLEKHLFNSLEDIKQHCDHLYAGNPTIHVSDSQISRTLQPASRTYSYIIDVLPIGDRDKTKKDLYALKDIIEKDGFRAKISHGKVENNGTYHVDLIVQDK